MCCRQASVSLLQEARFRYWSLTRLDRVDRPESEQEKKIKKDHKH